MSWSREEAPVALPDFAIPWVEGWLKLFPSTGAHAFESGRAQMPCQHWEQVMLYVRRSIGFRSFGQLGEVVRQFSCVDYDPLRSCEHEIGTVLRIALDCLGRWSQLGLTVTCVAVRGLAIVLAKRLDREHVLWKSVFDWISECINDSIRQNAKPMQDEAWMVGMDFLAQLHLEVKWNLRGEFPGLLAKLGRLDREDRFPVSFKYCLDVESSVSQSRPVKPRKNCVAQPSYVVFGLLNDFILDEVLKYLDYESIANLRATCQLVRSMVDQHLQKTSSLRLSIKDSKMAHLWMRPQPHVRELEIKHVTPKKPLVSRSPWPFGSIRSKPSDSLALINNRIYAKSANDKILQTVDISGSRLKYVFSTPSNNGATSTRFDKIAHSHISNLEDHLSKMDFHNEEKFEEEMESGAEEAYVYDFAHILRTKEASGRYVISKENVVVRSYPEVIPHDVFHTWFWTKTSYSKETVFALQCIKKLDPKSYLKQFLLETLDVKSRSVSGSITFEGNYDEEQDVSDVNRGMEHMMWGPLQCASENFVIAQFRDFDRNTFKSKCFFVNNEWTKVGEKCIRLKIKTLLIRGGLAVWKETIPEETEYMDDDDMNEHYVDDYTQAVTVETVVNILDVRPSTLARIVQNGENVFDLTKKIRVEGPFSVRPFEGGFFAFDYRQEKIKLKIFDMEKM